MIRLLSPPSRRLRVAGASLLLAGAASLKKRSPAESTIRLCGFPRTPSRE